jgi:hypothetical protein
MQNDSDCGDFAVYAKSGTILRVSLLLAVLTCCRSAWALSPPLITDDPETPGAGGWEINITSSIQQSREGTSVEAPLFDINYGFRDNDQFKIEFAVASADEPSKENHWGISDLLVGYKYRFLEEEDFGWAVSFYPQIASPTGNSQLGIGEGVTQLEIPFEFGKHFCDEKYFLNPEIGYNVVFDDSRQNSWKFGLAGETKVTEKLELMAEVGAFVFPQHFEPDVPFFNVGFEYVITKRVALLGSAGRSFRSRSDGAPDVLAMFGFEFTFGGSGEENEAGGDSEKENGDAAEHMKNPGNEASSPAYLREPTVRAANQHLRRGFVNPGSYR